MEQDIAVNEQEGVALAFQAVQMEFSHYLRTGNDEDRPPELEARRMEIYRDLFYKNTLNFCVSVFPVLKSIVGDSQFEAMVRRFMIDHRAHTPYFHEIGQEFFQWLSEQTEFQLPAYGLELAHYEWLELAMDIMDVDNSPAHANGNCWAEPPVLAAALACPSYHYAVHEVSKSHAEAADIERPTFLAVWRDRHDRVKFMEMNGLTWMLLNHMMSHPEKTGQTVADAVWDECNAQLGIERAVYDHGARQTLATLQENGIILGSRIQT